MEPNQFTLHTDKTEGTTSTAGSASALLPAQRSRSKEDASMPLRHTCEPGEKQETKDLGLLARYYLSNGLLSTRMKAI